MRLGLLVMVIVACACFGVGCSQQQAGVPAASVELASAAAPATVATVDFDSQVAPILTERCHRCHGGQQTKAGLNMLSKASLLAGGNSGSPVAAGSPDGSLIVQVIEGRHPEINQMPPKGGPLAPDQIATIRTWISEM